MNKVWIELDRFTGFVIRIFHTKRVAIRRQVELDVFGAAVAEMNYTIAVGQVRRQVFERDEHKCVKCGLQLVWNRGFWNSFEMDERQARGTCKQVAPHEYLSGEISVENSQSLCHNCHQTKHDRVPKFSSAAA